MPLLDELDDELELDDEDELEEDELDELELDDEDELEEDELDELELDDELEPPEEVLPCPPQPVIMSASTAGSHMLSAFALSDLTLNTCILFPHYLNANTFMT